MSDIVISSGQTLSGLLIGGGTEVTVSSGGTLLGASVASSGTLNVVGGYVTGTLVEYEDSNLTLGRGGVAVGTTLTAGAYAFVSSGGILSDTLVSEAAGATDLSRCAADAGRHPAARRRRGASSGIASPPKPRRRRRG